MTSRSGKELASEGEVEIDRKKLKCEMHELSEKKKQEKKTGKTRERSKPTVRGNMIILWWTASLAH